MNTKTLKKFGIADCYGIESYLDVKKKKKVLAFMQLRAEANRQRHAVVYEVEVLPAVDRKIRGLLKKKDWVNSLKVLKKEASMVSVMKRAGMKNSWGMIPNPKLDPYGA